MKLEIIQTNNAPKAIGQYSQGIKAGQFLFVSGQMPVNPQTGELITGDIQAQTKQVLQNVEAIIVEAGCTLKDVVKTTIFLKNMNQFGLVNDAYSKFFSVNPPARACVEVARLPKDVDVEIEAIVFIQP